MNIDHGKRTWSEAELDELRTFVREQMSAASISQAQVSRASGVAAATLSQFLSGNYAGDNMKIAGQLSRWLDARHRETEVLEAAPPEPTFVMTPTATKVINALQHAQVLGDMALIVGQPGVGKSAAARQYVAKTPRVVTATASPAVRTVSAILATLITNISGRAPTYRVRVECTNFIRSQLGDGWLLVIDEAQWCDFEALEEIRAIHDATRCGLALMGNAQVLSRIEGAARDPAYAQLFGRAGWRVRLNKSDANDVPPVLETMGVTAPEVVAYCQHIADRDSLRVVIKVVRSALMLSRAARQDLNPNHLAAAYRQLGDTARA
ncbi:MAG: AAA family ATPase [Phenylobacterium sp.]|uniref:AAA family ATPase n=1 Tax=Phenylobacterium sp. TaxID=1871053 RepID=UPI00391C3ABA